MTLKLKRKAPGAVPRVLYTGDTHLDLAPWVHRPIYKDSMWSFQYMVDFAIRKKLEAIVVAGDGLESSRPPAAVAEFIIAQLDKLREAGVKFYFVEGQHDRDPGRPWFNALHPWPICLHNETVVLNNDFVRGLSWQPADKLKEALALMPVPNHIVVCHQVWDEFMGDVTAPEGSLKDVKAIKAIVTGDLHKKRTIQLDSGVMVYSPGCTHMRKINEPHECFFFTHNEDGKFTSWKIPTRPVLDVGAVDIRMPEIMGQVLLDMAQLLKVEIEPRLEKLREYGAPPEVMEPIVRFKHSGELPIRKMIEELGLGQLHVFEILTQAFKNEQLVEAAPEDATLEEVLALEVARDSEDYAALRRLVLSDDPRAELAAMRAEHFAVEETSESTAAATSEAEGAGGE